MKVLEPFQEIGARAMASHFHYANADQPGLGKTVQAVEAAQMVNATSGLVTCPASVRTNWLEHIEERFGHTRGWDVLSYEGTRDPERRIFRLRPRYDVWIGDEIHFCKTCDSQRTLAVLGNDGLARRATYKWALSGTLSPNGRPVELYPMLKTLAPAFKDMSYAYYAQRYCGAYWDGRGLNAKGASRLDELSTLLRDFMVRRTKREVFPNRKAPLVSRVPLQLSASDLRAVREEEDNIGGREARLSPTAENFSALGDSSRLLRLLGEAKVPAVCRFVEDKLETVDKIVVFFHHTAVGELLREHFWKRGMRPVMYQGGMNDVQKLDAVRTFQGPTCRVFLGQRQAAGTGINGLQTVCSTAVLAEPSWTPGETEQLIDRLDRMGQNDDIVNFYIVRAVGTLDDAVVGVHDRKEVVGARLLGGHW